MRKVLVILVALALLIGTQIVAANAAVVTFRQLFGGSNPDSARGIFVDSNHIYIVGETNSFGPNTPNLFLSIFRLDNSHKCSVAVDLGGLERAWKVVAHGGNVYVSGDTNYGANPSNVLVVKFDTNCNVLGAAVYDIDGTDLPFGLSISPDGSTLYIAGFSASAAHLLAVRTSDFSVAWAKLFRVTGGGDAANSVTFSGNKLYVTGLTSTGDLFVSRFDAASGNHEASKVFSTPQPEEGRDVVVAGGKVYVAGRYDDPVKQREFLFMRLDTNLNLELAKTFGTNAFDDVTSLSMVGGLAYAVGMSNYFGSPDAALFAVNPSTGDLSHAFVLARDASVQIAQDSASTGSCLIYTGASDGWPAFYGVLDAVTAGTISFTISSPTPSIATPSVTPAFPTPTATGFTPTFNTPAMGDAFYSWFCPDVLVVSTTTTSTVLTTSTLSTTVTSVVGSTTTVYDVRTTTITQTSVTTTTSSTTTTLTQTATTTRTETTTLTQSTTYSTTTTLSTTLTYSTTTTLSTTTTSTQYFAEPVSTYVLPALLAVIAALLGASLVVGRRRRALPY
ncbi:MAG: YncE family protein [Candidatus Caldarchaeales archaeon]|jgi:hypothetical protein